jgi:hypothetical protein
MSDFSVGGIDLDHMVLLHDNFGAWIGEIRNRNDSITFTVPSQNTQYDLYVFNATNGAKYAEDIDIWIDQFPDGARLEFPSNATYHIEDRNDLTGPHWLIYNETATEQYPLVGAVPQILKAIQHPWQNYGSLTKVNNNGNFGAGYGKCGGHLGDHTATMGRCES